VLRIFVVLHFRGEKSHLIPLTTGGFAAHLIRVIIAIHINLPALFAALASNRFVSLLEIWSAAVSAAATMRDVGAIGRLGNARAVAGRRVDASAARIRAGPKIASVNKGITTGADAAAVIDPATDADIPLATGFGR
jgi:hypothetical protein